MDAPAIEDGAERLALPYQVKLAGKLGERPRAKPVRERRAFTVQVTRLG